MRRRYFAPLANEYRKAGDLSAAIALCRQELAKQPSHMSGYIVLGQALYESSQLDEARGAFEKAVALDPENLRGLRAAVRKTIGEMRLRKRARSRPIPRASARTRTSRPAVRPVRRAG